MNIRPVHGRYYASLNNMLNFDRYNKQEGFRPFVDKHCRKVRKIKRKNRKG